MARNETAATWLMSPANLALSMNRFALGTALLFTTVLHQGCASGGAAGSDIDRAEADRAGAALAAFESLMNSEERYGVFAGGQRIGYMLRERGAREGRLITIARIIDDANGTAPPEARTTLTEIFSATAPHDAILLQRKEAGGHDGTRSIRWTPQGYVAEFSVNGARNVEPLFDFQYRLADALAPQVWLRSGAAMSQCLTYPGYSLRRFSRNFNTECISQLTSYSINGEDVDAIETRRRSGTSVIRERGSGRELYNQAGRLGVELRLEPRAVATQQSAPPRETGSLASLAHRPGAGAADASTTRPEKSR